MPKNRRVSLPNGGAVSGDLRITRTRPSLIDRRRQAAIDRQRLQRIPTQAGVEPEDGEPVNHAEEQ